MLNRSCLVARNKEKQKILQSHHSVDRTVLLASSPRIACYTPFPNSPTFDAHSLVPPPPRATKSRKRKKATMTTTTKKQKKQTTTNSPSTAVEASSWAKPFDRHPVTTMIRKTTRTKTRQQQQPKHHHPSRSMLHRAVRESNWVVEENT